MLSNEQWADLKAKVPEVTESLGSLTELAAQLQDFRRPMGPDEAVTVMQGLEALSRIVDLLSAVTLSVFERTGTPKDYGAKTTKALVQDKLKLSGTEAHRRTELAKNLGNRVDITGQSRPPKYPLVAEGLQSGRLSSSQATAITECLKDLPFWLGADMRTKVEQKLVTRAPTVRVSDIRRIFADMLDRLDPDGEEPKDSHDRSHYRVNVRQRRDGDWDLSGLLDPISGGILQGWLTSRIKADDPASGEGDSAAGNHAAPPDGTAMTGSPDSAAPDSSGAVQRAGQGEVPPDDQGAAPDSGQLTEPTGGRAADEQEIIDLFGSVLSGDISDARIPADPFPTDPSHTDAAPTTDAFTGATAQQNRGWGVREDGSFVDTTDAQGSVKNLMYERFATLLSRIEMGRVGRGAPFALVVTATAENLAEKKGRAETGDEADFPVDLAVDEGLNGSVFFHLMSDRAKSLSLATEQRYATPKQLAVLAARDQGCTFPGCETPPGWCDAHHIVPWSNGGKTDINNLTLACGLHHHLIDKSDWYAYMLFDGRPAWIPPASIDVERRPVLHARFIAREAAESLFDEVAGTSAAGVRQRGTSEAGVSTWGTSEAEAGQRGTSAAQVGPKGTSAPTAGPDEASGPGTGHQGTSATVDGRIDAGGPVRDPDPSRADNERGGHADPWGIGGQRGVGGPREDRDPPGYSDSRGDDDPGERA
ncbi:HNH endonuclease signature motif containing protein [Brevibacterium metallidurans]|uniref:HNH nuclease domain-containing protein n=1 Tax=Brevibacterium metallidurans TaxID=1482676 RepID=A0ABN0SNN3_9MICO